ncbi:hypothetical protein [Pyxidicoccus sp. MSG2]|uniref:hypothetical protein n=1 Tax=Pyxidicoccus sp. MSG2 TaxID=2996790 RepID=UPI00226F2B26|nr:hypothetical protein [Pyxidicoccus sp. MSG2]MCY1019602.1 hypothetical protein [Pyxidicoccus sp. MSG2]
MELGHLNPASLPSGTHIGPWRVVEPHGRGAYGVVYRAVGPEEAAGFVALKLALSPGDARFAREAELLSRLHHPAVPRLLDHGQWQAPGGASYAWLVMELVEGAPLHDYPPSTHPDDEDAWLWRTEARSAWLPRAFNVRCSEELSARVSRMLSPDPAARGSAREVAEALEQAARKAGPEADAPLFTGDEPRPAGLFPPLQRVTVRPPPRAARRSGFTAARLGGALALCAVGLLSALSVRAPATGQLEEEDASKDAGTVAVGDSALTAPEVPEEAPSVWPAISEDLPLKPLPGQRRPDAKGRCPGKMQVAINGACWRKQPITDMKDCDDDAYVYRGACYVPTFVPPPRATSGPTQRADGG